MLGPQGWGGRGLAKNKLAVGLPFKANSWSPLWELQEAALSPGRQRAVFPTDHSQLESHKALLVREDLL